RHDQVAELHADHTSVAPARRCVRRGGWDDLGVQDLHAGIPDDRRRPRGQHDGARLLYLPHGLPVLRDGLRLCHVVHPAGHRAGAHIGPVPPAPHDGGVLIVPTRSRLQRTATRSTLYLMLGGLTLAWVTPYVWMLASSLRPQAEIFQYVTPLSWKTFVPQSFTLASYRELFALVPFPFSRYVFNSIFVALSVTTLSLIVNALAAYAFARLEFPGRSVLFAVFRQLVIPNSIPALVAFALIRFQASWDAFLWPLIAAPSAEKRVIQVAIASFVTEVQTRWDLTFAASVVATLPVAAAFLVLQ